jgi:4-hydroxymandelate oxidase
VSSVDTSLSLWGSVLRTPVAVAPTAFHRLPHPEGEVATAAAAAQAGALFVLSTRCSCRIEDVGAAVAEWTPARRWPWPGRPRWPAWPAWPTQETRPEAGPG